MNSNSDHMLNEHEVARELGISVKTLRKWRWAGEGLEYVKLGRAVRYERQAIDAFKEAGRRTSTSHNAAA